MEITFAHESAAPIEVAYEELVDLAQYPYWMQLVRSADLTSSSDAFPVWTVTLTGSVGKLRRSKRLRMELVESLVNSFVVFERREVDSRTHSVWRLRVELETQQPGCLIRVSLRYDGGLWEPLVERMLRGEIETSRARLEQRLCGLSNLP